MRLVRLQRLLFCALLGAMGGAACGPSMDTAVPEGLAAEMELLENAIAASSGYPAASIEVLASGIHVHVLISDDDLARADQGTRERAARAVVVGVEQAMASDIRLHAIDEISIAIVHPEKAQGLLRSSHTEDVFYFNKGPDQHFSPDVL